MHNLFLSAGLGACVYVLVDPLLSLCTYSSIRPKSLVLIKYRLKEAKNVSLLAYFLSADNKGPT